jgi:GGDEF domain-containing protein
MSTQPQKIAFIRKLSPNDSTSSLVSHFPDVQSLIAAQDAYDIILLDQPATLAVLSIKLLRLNATYRFKLVYSIHQQDPTIAALSDGPPPKSLDAMRDQWAGFADRLHAFNQGETPESLETRMLAYLWMREDISLKCVKNPKLNQHYHYPLLDAIMGGEKVHAFSWLTLMEEKLLLEPGEIRDRIRMCRGCGSGRLNYVDICPECSDLNIERTPAIHCFTCGHVAHENKFIKGDAMSCPNCQQRLRHIGVDYDRPMENYSCGNCKAFFVDPKIEARCLECGEEHEPSSLRVQVIRDFKLTEKARMLCRNGLFFEQTVTEHFAKGNFVSFDSFKALLNWQLQLSRRYPESKFTVLGLHLANLSTVIAKLGFIKGNAFSTSLVERISNMLRETDRACRSLDDHVWILLTHTDAKGALHVEPRIQELAKLFSGEVMQDLKFNILRLESPPAKGFAEDAEMLLRKMKGEASSKP